MTPNPTNPPVAADTAETVVITRAGIIAGMVGIAPIALFVVPFGLAFGVAASQQGMDLWMATLMSALVCAGAAQFAALELWAAPLPVLPILITVAAINARHLLYGAAIYPWLKPLTPMQRFPILAVMTDTSWAYAMQAAEKGRRDAGLLLGSGLLCWIVWTLSTAAGAWLGTGIGNPKAYGLDVVLVAFFAANLVGMWRGRADLAPWLAAAAGALAGFYLLPPGWHVLSGALAGGLAGIITDDA